ncbi:ABC transporter permease [Fangia hongkongensis]|uniref:ABC transporter permease n=1 Tax=Fangia hongkongensis TaxID=270495 RepID=UPI0003778ED0|nr:ABC transporter permease subunit [Fangia hongkongensis]MBK2125304.1 ABC transporter permease subunit [Fangia hongkongensis]
MFSYILRRLGGAIPTLFAVILISFLMVHMTPGDPFATERALPPEVLKQLHHQYHLDLPLWQQFLYYLNDLIHGNLGYSFKYQGQSINHLVFPTGGQGGFWVSVQLGVFSIIVASIFGVIFGIFSALTRNTKVGFIDHAISIIAMLFISTPIVVTAPLAVLIFAVLLGWFPAGGWGSWSDLVLPVIVLAIPYIAIITQITRSSLIEIMSSPFIRTAKAKGLSMPRIVWKHALKPSLMPVVSFLGPAVAGILTGSVVVETVFTIPGIGVQVVQGATNRDYNLVLALTIIYSLLVIIFNLVVDIIYAFLDPKIRY